MPYRKLPKPILDELHAAQARIVSDFNGPKGRRYQVWFGGNAAIVLIELHEDEAVFLWRPLEGGSRDRMTITVDALRAYLANPNAPEHSPVTS
jgi:hypothetical protein